MGKVDPLSNIYEPFAVLFWALDIVLYLPTSDPARQPGITPTPYTIHVLIWSQLIQFSRKTPRPLPPFLSIGLLLIYSADKLAISDGMAHTSTALRQLRPRFKSSISYNHPGVRACVQILGKMEKQPHVTKKRNKNDLVLMK